jgi:hypothetical protein
MFISSRPFTAVLAGLGTALVVVLADGLCQRPPTGDAAAPVVVTHSAGHEAVTCVVTERCGIVRAGS